MGKDNIEVAVLQYADDTIVFCPYNSEIIDRWWEILNLIMVGSGLSLNLGKTSIVGINMCLEDVTVWVAKFGYQVDSLPISYLGYPLGGNHHQKTFWDPLIDIFRAKFEV